MSAPQSFSWARLIVEHKLRGLPAVLAMHAQPVWYNAETPYLRLEMPPELTALRTSPAMKALEQALHSHFGKDLQLEVVDGPAALSPAAQSAARKLERERNAHEAIMNDSMVQDMIREYGARILTETVCSTAPAGVSVRKPQP